jgi:hypothetical protein
MLAAAFAISGCSSDDDDGTSVTPDGGGGSAGTAGVGGTGGDPNGDGQAGSSGSGGTYNPDGGSVAACNPLEFAPGDGGVPVGDGGTPLPAARRLVAGVAVPLGVTNGGHVVYRENNKISVRSLEASGEPFELTALPGTTVIKGDVVFHWSAIDYEAGRADLMIWTGGTCSRNIGSTLAADTSVAVSNDASHVLYPVNVTDRSFDLVVASRDFTHQQIIATGVGRPSDSTCRPEYGFAGSRVVATTCAPGSQDGSLKVYKLDAGAWSSVSVGDNAAGPWAANANGERLFYTTTRSVGVYWDAATATAQEIDEGVAWGLWVNGSSLLYAVAGQLRRASLPDLVPIPIVTNRFRYVGSWSPDYNYALYSTTVTYEGGEKRDLLLSRTTSFTPTPTKLVNTPLARLSRSGFTTDGRYVLYLTDVDARGAGTLHVRPVSGGDERTLTAVDTAVAARDSLIVFSSNRSDPTVYPIVAELKVVDASTADPETLLRATIIDGRSFYLTPDKQAVIYSRPRDGQDASTDGLWIHPLPAPVVP